LGYKLGESPHNKLVLSFGLDLSLQKSYYDVESDEDVDDIEEEHRPQERGDEEEEGEIIESDVELEGETVEPDHLPCQKMGDLLSRSRKKIVMLLRRPSDKPWKQFLKLEEAIVHLTRAILLNPTSSIMYASKASACIKMKKPNAAIRYANAALEVKEDILSSPRDPLYFSYQAMGSSHLTPQLGP
ncbi:FAM10 family protein, partial [Actinidia chinensis var. chinensis]